MSQQFDSRGLNLAPQQVKSESLDVDGWYYEEPTHLNFYVRLMSDQKTLQLKVTRRQLEASLRRMNAARRKKS